ncbi:hypothetical protein K432DRAFT_195503 [Lepidopterella palustris CBS 459.81]|uniref:Uncharacterized protein n=1 Tax=Lepidopterella palustris CBS 459.81 TaxID=1314670 RepID=A0A8E2EFJ3_9PEZI|nr:hypothetical protein K432DRAFT_195503 [Lepidopterella palustris CBS 459.81]
MHGLTFISGLYPKLTFWFPPSLLCVRARLHAALLKGAGHLDRIYWHNGGITGGLLTQRERISRGSIVIWFGSLPDWTSREDKKLDLNTTRTAIHPYHIQTSHHERRVVKVSDDLQAKAPYDSDMQIHFAQLLDAQRWREATPHFPQLRPKPPSR